MRDKFRKKNDQAKPQLFSFAELLTSTPTKKIKKVTGNAKKLKRGSAPEAFAPHEDTEF